MNLWYVITPIVLWILTMIILLSPPNLWTNTLDRITKAKYRKDRAQLSIMLDNLQSNPDQWSITREGASYPLQGAKQIYLSFNKDKQLEYSLNAFGSTPRPLEGYFGKQFSEQLEFENSRREAQSLLRTFYPELDGPLLLK